MNSVISRIQCSAIAFMVLCCFSLAAIAADPAPAAASVKATETSSSKVAPATSAPSTTPAPAEQPAVASAATPLPPAQITIGGLFSDNGAEGYGDVLIPVLMIKSGLLFVEPRGSLNDSDEQEFNFGVGYRNLFPDKNFILGANVFYDHRETSLDNGFDQFGFGLEFLSKWVDARANYYLPEDDVKVADRYVVSSSQVTESQGHGGEVTGDGNQIVQETYITDSTYDVQVQQHYQIYEQALEGFDCEVGALLPIPVVQDYADVKAFVGYYDFDSDINNRVKGMKARLEIRPMPSVYVDAVYHEDDELYGSTYSVGARAVMPFDLVALSNGKSPFAGALDGFKLSKTKAPLSSRLTEMVIRDLHVRTDESKPEEVIEDRILKSKTLVSKKNRDKKTVVIKEDVTFVDDDNQSGKEDGSWEHPYSSIQEGVNDPRSMVYVRDAGREYYENVVMTDGVILWGSGCPIYGRGDRFLGGVYPVVNGGGNGPAITLANNTTVAGFEITQPDEFLKNAPSFGQPGILGVNVTGVDVHCNYIHGSGSTGHGIQISDYGMTQFEGSFWNNRITDVRGSGMALGFYDVDEVNLEVYGNTVTDADQDGIAINAVYGSGLATILVDDNVTSGNGWDGLEVDARDFHDVNVQITRHTAEGNYGSGVDLAVSAHDSAMVLLEDVVATDNENGININYVSAGYGATVLMSDIDASGNYDNGILFGRYGQGSPIYTANGEAFLGMANVVANNNGGSGIRFDNNGYYSSYSYSDGYGDSYYYDIEVGSGDPAVASGNGDASIYLANIEASQNGAYGIFFGGGGAKAYNGDAIVSMDGIEANDNGRSGIYVAQDYAHYGYSGHFSDYADYGWGYSSYSFSGYMYMSQEAPNALADATYGDASVYMTEVTATGNGFNEERTGKANGYGAYGIYIGGYGARSYAGDALFYMDEVDVSGNSDGGLRVAQSDNYWYYYLNNSHYDASYGDTSYYGYSMGWYSENPIPAAVAHAVNGDATVVLSDVLASYNWGNGIYVGGYGAHSSGYGEASFRAHNVTADGNWGDGIHFAQLNYGYGYSRSENWSDSSGYGYSGNSYYSSYGYSAGYSYGSGIAVANGRASVVFENVSASGNYGDGIYVGGPGAKSWNDDASVSFYDVSADYNSDSGIVFDQNSSRSSWQAEYGYSMYTDYGYADWSVNREWDWDQSATYGNAIAVSYGYYGDAMVSFYGVSADYNGYGYGKEGYYGNYGSYGIYVGGSGAVAHNGDASVYFENVNADGNVDGGIHFASSRHFVGSSGRYGYSIDVGNGAYGYSYYGSYGYSSAAEWAPGVAVAYNGDAVVSLYNVSASYNGDDGIHLASYGARAYNGDATFIMENVEASGNYGDGIHFGMNRSYYDRNWNYDDDYYAGGGASYSYYNSWGESHGDWTWGNAVAEAEYGSAYVSMVNVSANWNNGNGIFVGGYGALAAGGDATFAMYNVDAYANAGDGIHFAQDYASYDYWSYVDEFEGGYSYYGYYSSDYNNWFYSDAGYGNAVAFSDGGDATVSMIDIDADMNGVGYGYKDQGYYGYGHGLGYGIFIGGYGAFATDGTASFLMEDVSAEDNAASGIFFAADYGYSNGGSYNYWYDYDYYSSSNYSYYDDWASPVAVARSEYGSAYATFEGVDASYNGYGYYSSYSSYGIHLGYGAVAYYGDAVLVMDDVNANWNSHEGIAFHAGWGYGSDYNYSYNTYGAYGPYYDSYYYWTPVAMALTSYGDATARLTDVDAIGNGDEGICVQGIGAAVTTLDFGYGYGYGYGYGFGYGYGNATLILDGVDASANDEGGVYIEIFGSMTDEGDAIVDIIDSQFSDNQDDSGVDFDWGYAAVSGDGDASVRYLDVDASWNDGDGIQGGGALAFGYHGNASVDADGLTASYNDGDGLDIEIYSDEGTAGFLMADSVLAYNDDNGLDIEAYTWDGDIFLCMGLGEFIGGNNSVYDNDNYDVSNNGDGLLWAEDNWWGSVDPYSYASFDGAVEIDPWLLSDPNDE